MNASMKIRICGLGLLAGVVFGAAALAEDPPAGNLDDVRQLIKGGKYAEAEERARALLVDVESASGATSAEYSAVLDALVESLWRGGKVREAQSRTLAEQALDLKIRALGPDHADVAESLNNLAVILYFNGAYGEARPLWERAVAIRERALGSDAPDVARSLNSLANLLQTIGDYAGARKLYERALEIREKAFGPDHDAVAQTLTNLTLLLWNAGDYAGALPLAERAVEIRQKKLGEHPSVAYTLTALGNLYTELGDYDAAQPIFERTRQIFEKTLGAEHNLVAVTLNNLAWMLQKKGDYDAARPLYERALEVATTALGPEHGYVGACLNNLAGLSETTGDLAAAGELYQRALAVREKALGNDHPDVAETLSSHANVLLRTGDFAAARPLVERALSIRRQVLGPEHPSVAASLNTLAALLAATGHTADALERALDAERISRNHLRLTGRSLSEQMALRYAAVRNRGLDLVLTLASNGLAPESRWRVMDALSRSRAVVLDEMAARNRTVSAADDPEIVRLAAQVNSARSRLANLTVKGLGDDDPEKYRKLLDEARQDKERAERDLAAASVAFATEQRRRALGLEDAAAQLPAGSVLVSFAQYESFDLTPVVSAGEPSPTSNPPTPAAEDSEPVPSYVAFVLVQGKRQPVAVDLGPAEAVDALISTWKSEAAGGIRKARGADERAEAAYLQAGRALRRVIWDPLVEHLGGVKRVFIVPDGTLNLVSFAALPGEDAHFLIENGPLLHYLSAERDLASAATSERLGEGLFVLGGPDYDDKTVFSTGLGSGKRPLAGDGIAATRGTRSACGSFDTLHFEPLPGSAKEAQEVVDLRSRVRESRQAEGSDVVYIRGSGATEAALKKAVPGKRVLHLATHGFFLGGDCDSSSEGSRGFTVVTEPEPSSVEGVNPLLLSGLALAGANHRRSAGAGEDDGILTAEEIAGLDLSGVEWAVLSACDTGVGEVYAGEGVFGLRRAIQLAGVRTMIMSLWPVDDEATRSWMLALYEGRWLEGLDTSEAVHAASLRSIRERREAGLSTHPFYWAAFVAAGDWR